MTGPQAELTRTLTIDLVQSSGPIRGRLADGHHDPTPFAAWLELAAALEGARGNGGGDEEAKRRPRSG